MPHILSVARSPVHGFSKQTEAAITLVAHHGVEGDAHAGATTQHLYRMRKDPTAPNLCQVHLLHAELFAELAARGISISAGQMGENITTTGIELLSLPLGTRLTLGPSAVVEITGLREPCSQMNTLHPGLMKACIARSPTGAKIRKAGIMAIVLTSGTVHPGDPIKTQLPPSPWLPLGPV